MPSLWGRGVPACLPVRVVNYLGKIVRKPSYTSFLFVYQVLELFNLAVFNFIKPSFTYRVNEALAFSKSLC